MRTRRADFDQQSLGKWLRECSNGKPDLSGEPTYVFRWNDTGCGHSQASLEAFEDESWYDKMLGTNQDSWLTTARKNHP